MPTYITAAEVRLLCGAGTDLMSDADVNSLIDLVEAETERWLNSKFIPTRRMDILDGNDTIRIFVDKNPLLTVRQCKINGDTEDPAGIFFDRESGMLQLDTTAELTNSRFIAKDQAIAVDYYYGWVEETTTATNTSTTAATTAGTSVSVLVSSITGFVDEDWVMIKGMDGKWEAAQISGTPSGSTIVLDQLVKAHESGSLLTKIEIPAMIEKFMRLEAAIAVAINATGSTYTFNASYSIGEFSVTKGVPYTHWREVVAKLSKERDLVKGALKPRPYVTV